MWTEFKVAPNIGKHLIATLALTTCYLGPKLHSVPSAKQEQVTTHEATDMDVSMCKPCIVVKVGPGVSTHRQYVTRCFDFQLFGAFTNIITLYCKLLHE